MSYTTIQPCEELKAYISHFWVATWQEQLPAAGSTYYVTASSLTELAFGFAGPDLMWSSAQGHTCNHGQYPAGGFYGLFGVSMYSHAVPALFHLPASELNDRFLSLDTLLGNDGKMMEERIAMAANTQERIGILTGYFMAQVKREKLRDSLISNAARYIRIHSGMANIVNISRTCCLSQKQFERRFKAFTGFNPKLYARIVRFETTLNNYARYHSLTEAAHANGYYDQAHFIRDFRTFAGYSPVRFLELSGY
ncbi:AraC family transcriptional regulator [Chitinophaga lutea]|uniref:AraC family transcriptional regulator n=1 Tax=Chitinophaga lutea TaxID=2488634 RepID=A0A3N4PWV4_9BACT|nr:helix-turn-helix domain-containing protein [Chitinophaga lutea]RPE08170.1 AraC family transcriptional regulator [Chitinophaga lutea]